MGRVLSLLQTIRNPSIKLNNVPTMALRSISSGRAFQLDEADPVKKSASPAAVLLGSAPDAVVSNVF